MVHVGHDCRRWFDRGIDRMHVVHFVPVVLVSAMRTLLRMLPNKATSAGETIRKRIIVPSLQWDTPRIEPFVVLRYYLLDTLFSDDNTCVTPREIILFPEGIERKNEREDRES